jgi:acetyl esterase/lipase
MENAMNSRSRHAVVALGCAAALILSVASCSSSELPVAPVETVKPALTTPQQFSIWPGTAPGSENWTQHENEIDLLGSHVVYNVVQPTLTAYFPDPKIATGAAIIVAPGGGFRFLSVDNEGADVPHWLAAHGIASFILKYRTVKMPDSSVGFVFEALKFVHHLTDLGGQATRGEINLAGGPDTTGSDAPENIMNWPAYGAADGVQAMKILRAHAAQWGIDPKRIGFMGFSAGSMVTYGVLLSAPPADMPDLAATMYYSLSPKIAVPANAPPLFLGAASDDPISRGMPETYMHWIAAGHPAELHMWAKGGHGFGMTKQGTPTDNWPETFYAWLNTEGFLKAK